MADDLHSALRTEEIDSTSHGLSLKLVRLQQGKDLFSYSLHAFPDSYSSAGLQTTDLLAFLGFHRGPCGFGHSECYATKVSEGFKLAEFTEAFRKFSELVRTAEPKFAACGLYLPQPEGWGYFLGGSGRPDRQPWDSHARGDGHHSPKQERMKESEDHSFRYVFTWIEGSSDRGWVIVQWNAGEKDLGLPLPRQPFQAGRRIIEGPAVNQGTGPGAGGGRSEEIEERRPRH